MEFKKGERPEGAAKQFVKGKSGNPKGKKKKKGVNRLYDNLRAKGLLKSKLTKEHIEDIIWGIAQQTENEAKEMFQDKEEIILAKALIGELTSKKTRGPMLKYIIERKIGPIVQKIETKQEVETEIKVKMPVLPVMPVMPKTEEKEKEEKDT